MLFAQTILVIDSAGETVSISNDTELDFDIELLDVVFDGDFDGHLQFFLLVFDRSRNFRGITNCGPFLFV